MSGITRDDAAIAADVRESLHWDQRLDDTHVAVSVLEGVVALTGTVGTLGEKHIAVENAWRIKGVREVVDDLAVQPLAVRTDDDIAADVYNALCWDTRVDESQIRVDVSEAVVRLTGTVGTAAEKRAAVEDARYVPGVADVEDAIVTVPMPPRPDSEIEAGVRAALTHDTRITDPTRISVDSVEGTVFLRGGVENPRERSAADDDAWFTVGVSDVVNELAITPLQEPPPE